MRRVRSPTGAVAARNARGRSADADGHESAPKPSGAPPKPDPRISQMLPQPRHRPLGKNHNLISHLYPSMHLEQEPSFHRLTDPNLSFVNSRPSTRPGTSCFLA